ncbi:MAG: hypothetical protein KY476_19735, partial [Planctomycetes bacterium]|nr:hypothetical protein [Planctomycetota bacterium]
NPLAPAISEYETIYRSIPFRRSEYDAQPSYRHDAAMEILTGNPRPARIELNNINQAQSAPYGFAPPVLPYRPAVGYLTPWSYHFRPYFGWRGTYGSLWRYRYGAPWNYYALPPAWYLGY